MENRVVNKHERLVEIDGHPSVAQMREALEGVPEHATVALDLATPGSPQESYIVLRWVDRD